MGGKEVLCNRLDELFSMAPIYEVGSYGKEIHEMTEMAAVNFGQCAISNQPSFHLPYLYTVLGKGDKARYWIKRVLRELFDSGVDGFPGDEDNGSMSAWYLFSALGFYPLCPGKAEYISGIPLFKKIWITFENGKQLLIHTKENEYGKKLRITVDGREKHTAVITQEELLSAAEVIFEEY